MERADLERIARTHGLDLIVQSGSSVAGSTHTRRGAWVILDDLGDVPWRLTIERGEGEVGVRRALARLDEQGRLDARELA